MVSQLKYLCNFNVKVTIIALILTLAFSNFIYADSRNFPVLEKLDRYIIRSDEFRERKEARISLLMRELDVCDDQSKEYDLLYCLFDEYKSFKYDSAYCYANKAYSLAVDSGQNDNIVRAHCALVFCYLSSGLFLEAFDEIKKVDISGVTAPVKAEYYQLCNRLCYDASDFNETENWSREYSRIGTLYADSLMAVVPEDSYEYLLTLAQKQIKNSYHKECIDTYKKILRSFALSDHDKAVINSSIGGAYRIMHQNDSAVVYLAKAAVNDIVSATTETTALYRLAEILYEMGDNERAYTYIHKAVEDANFYNARHRKLSINPILPIIEQTKVNAVMKQRNMMLYMVCLCFVLLVVIVVAGVIVIRQNRKLKRRSSQLAEANKIKDEYIGNSFYINSEYIADTEEMYKTIQQMIAARQYDELRREYKMSKIARKRESMYESFDKCFLNIFPTFVSEYASLFPEGMIDANATSLSSEMRIFALIRLGITDSERIAKFLNYSVHTIYTYKTRVKNKSIVSNDEFELRIKAVEMHF